MTGRVRAIALLVLVGALLLPPAASARVQVSDVGGAAFPDRTFLLTLPTRQVLEPGQTIVTENREPVSDLKVYPNSQSGGTTFGTVLVIDASSSMHGGAIDSAVRAARAFADQHDPRQPLGVVFFASTGRVALPLTTDRKRIRLALQTVPRVDPGTHLYDAVQLATKMLTSRHVAAGAIVVLSDGFDTGSTATERSVAAAARAAHLRIYAVGLETRAFAQGALSSLATAAGGTFATATKQGVRGLYGRLGTELSNQYLVRYRSTAKLGTAVKVKVRVAGIGSARTAYFAPSLHESPLDGPTKKTFWQSELAIALVVGFGALLVGLGALALVAPRDSVRSRVGQFVSVPAPTDERAWSSALIERALGETRHGERRRLLGRLVPTTEELELARVGMTRPQVGLASLAATVFTAVLVASASGSVVFGVLLALLVPYAVRILLRIQLQRQRQLFDSQLPDNLQVIASAMRAGHTFLSALGVMVADAPLPSRREFRRVLADEQIGVPLATALTAVAERMGSTDFEHVALVATLQAETGGNTAEVIDQVTTTIRERQDLRRLISTLTAQGRLAGAVVSGLPVVLLLLISLINPRYVHPLFHRSAGILMLVVAALMLFAGATTIKKIVEIDV